MYLVDYRLGGRSGLELVRQELGNSAKTPIILLTGQGDHQVDVEAMNAGAADFLVKDRIDASSLERAIRYAVEHARAEDERARLEQQLLHSQKLEAVGQLAGGVAHDFNNLLTAILSYTQLGMSSAPPGSRLGGQLKEILKAAQRAADLTQQLLAFSRRQVMEPQPLNLNDIVLDTHKMLRRLIGTDIELVTLPGPDLGLVTVDPAQMEQVIINLSVNARDAMPDGGKLIIEAANTALAPEDLAERPELAPGEYVSLSVSDTGVGMDPEVMTRIFEPFFTTKAQGKGTGLGLSTCYGILKQNGGDLTVESTVGKGSKFTLYLPRTSEVLPARADAEAQDHLPRGEETVLLAEDEEKVRGVVARVLREQGYTVLEARNGGEALRVAEGQNGNVIDLLLTDVVMPLLGGKELADRLRQLHAVKRVLYTSGYADPALDDNGLMGPSAGFLRKPFTPAALAKRVREVLDGG